MEGQGVCSDKEIKRGSSETTHKTDFGKLMEFQQVQMGRKKSLVED